MEGGCMARRSMVCGPDEVEAKGDRIQQVRPLPLHNPRAAEPLRIASLLSDKLNVIQISVAQIKQPSHRPQRGVPPKSRARSSLFWRAASTSS